MPLAMSGFMFNVILPSKDADAVTAMQSALDKNYNIYLVTASAVLTLTGETVYYTRLSAQVSTYSTVIITCCPKRLFNGLLLQKNVCNCI